MKYLKRLKIPSIAKIIKHAWDKSRKTILWSSGVVCIGLVVWGYFKLDSPEKREEARSVVYPILLGVGGVWLNREFQKAQDRRAELDRKEQREQEEFKTYLEKMEQLIKDGIESEEDDTFKIAQALTANVLRELTEERQNQVMFFLDSLKLVKKNEQKSQVNDSDLPSNNHLISLFRGIRLINADLRNIYAIGIDADAADLSGANLEKTDLSYANFRKANLSNANLKETNFFEANLQRVDLSETKLYEAFWFETNLQGADLYKADFEGASLTLVNFQEANLSKANFQGASFDEPNLKGANLSGADLREAKLRNANLEGAKLSVSLSSLFSLDRGYTDLTRADLVEANLQKANLSSANLQWANLSGANLQEANLSKADLRGANLLGANLEGANLQGSIYCETTMPDGSINNQDCDLK
ncbi:MAG: pentapeptide repeat-containing protein [Cyanobacteria bacterium P01_G01_bin.54]